MSKDNNRPESQAPEAEHDAVRVVFDAATGKSKKIKLTDEELATFEPVSLPTPLPAPSVPDKEALAKAIADCKNLERLKDLLIKDILPLL